MQQAVTVRGDLTLLANLILTRLEDCTDRVLRRLHQGGLVAPATDERELADDVRMVLDLSLRLLHEDRPAHDDELADCTALGRRRARQGVDVGSVVRWLHTTELVLWELVTDLAKDAAPSPPQLLLQHAARFWATFDDLSSAATDGHHETTRSLAIGLRQQGLALVAAIENHPESALVAEELARSLGLDPHGPLVVVVHEGEHHQVPWDGGIVLAEQATRTLVIAQPASSECDAEAMLASSIEDAGLAPAGVGLLRDGIAGAQLSLRDAELAAAAARATGAVLCFREHWLEALGVAFRDEHEPMVAPAVNRIRSDPALRATLQAHVEHRGSLTAAGRALGLHANTVAYRLRQFAEHTGVDPRTASGLALTQTALVLADADEPALEVLPASHAAS